MKLLNRFVEANKAYLNYVSYENVEPKFNLKAVLNAAILYVLMTSLFLGVGYLFDIQANLTYLFLSLSTSLLCSLLLYNYKFLYDEKYPHDTYGLLLLKAFKMIYYLNLLYLLIVAFVFWEHQSILNVILSGVVILITTLLIGYIESREIYDKSRSLLTGLLQSVISYVVFIVFIQLYKIENVTLTLTLLYTTIIIYESLSYVTRKNKFVDNILPILFLIGFLHIPFVFNLSWIDLMNPSETRTLYTDKVNFKQETDIEKWNDNVYEGDLFYRNDYSSVFYEYNDLYYNLVRHRQSNDWTYYHELFIYDKELNLMKRYVFDDYQEHVFMGFVNDALYLMINNPDEEDDLGSNMYYFHRIDGLDYHKEDVVGIPGDRKEVYEDAFSYFVIDNNLYEPLSSFSANGYVKITSEEREHVYPENVIEDELIYHSDGSYYGYSLPRTLYSLKQSNQQRFYGISGFMHNGTVLMNEPSLLEDDRLIIQSLEDLLEGNSETKVLLDKVSDDNIEMHYIDGIIVNQESIILLNYRYVSIFSLDGTHITSFEIDNNVNNLSSFITNVSEDTIILSEYDKSIKTIDLDNPVTKVFYTEKVVGYGELSLVLILFIVKKRSLFFN